MLGGVEVLFELSVLKKTTSSEIILTHCHRQNICLALSMNRNINMHVFEVNSHPTTTVAVNNPEN